MFGYGAYLRSTKKNNYLNVFISNRVPPQLTRGKDYHNTHTSLTLCFVLGYVLHVSILLHHLQGETISFIHSLICLTTGPMPPPKRCLHIVRSRASSFKWEYPLLSLRSSSSFLRLLPRLLATSISPFIFRSITCFRRQFLRKMCPIQLAFRFLILILIMHINFMSYGIP